MTDAEFIERNQCITCGSQDLRQLSQGKFSESPVNEFISGDPFGENPLPYLQNAHWHFVQCKQCGQKFHGNVLNEEWTNIYYSRWITAEAIEAHARAANRLGFDEDFAKGKHAAERTLQLERLTRKTRGSNPVRVLDFGCGSGQFLATCACFGFESTGVEFSAAREKTKLINFFENLEQVSEAFGPNYFHAAVLFEVLEHLTHPLETLRAIRPLVRQDGILILETPNCSKVTSIDSMQSYRLISPLGHINAFTPDTQERIAKEAGFRRIVPSVVQCTADPLRAYKRELRRWLRPFLPRYTQQYFVAV